MTPTDPIAEERRALPDIDLITAAKALIERVEGCLGDRWTANGKRLVDTSEWCRFYVVAKRESERLDALPTFEKVQELLLKIATQQRELATLTAENERLKAEVAVWKRKYEAADVAYSNTLAIHGTVMKERDDLRKQLEEATQRGKAWRECAEGFAEAIKFDRDEPIRAMESALAVFDKLASEEAL